MREMYNAFVAAPTDAAAALRQAQLYVRANPPTRIRTTGQGLCIGGLIGMELE